MSAAQTAESTKRRVTKAAPKKTAKQAVPAKAAAKKAAPKVQAAPAKKKAAPRVVETITLKSIFEQIAEGLDMPKRQGHAIAAELVAAVTSALKNGDKLRLTGLGVLEVKDRPARMGRNPATGASVQVAASRKISFRPSKELKEAV